MALRVLPPPTQAGLIKRLMSIEDIVRLTDEIGTTPKKEVLIKRKVIDRLINIVCIIAL